MSKTTINFIRDFLVDRLYLTIFFFGNSFLLILLFYLSNARDVPLIYPSIIAIFMYLLLMTVEFFRYYKFHEALAGTEENAYFDLDATTNSQKRISDAINKLNNNYLNVIEEHDTKMQEQKHFLSHFIHRIKSPVSVIALIAQKSEGLEDLNCLRQEIKSIEEENKRIHKFLEQILTILRLDVFARDYVTETIDLVADIKEVINNNKKKFIYNDIFPKITANKDTLKVLSDSKWNKIMLEQVVSNAIKYSAAGENNKVEFIISQGNKKTTLIIEDEGIGIPEYDLRAVWEPFFTGDNGRKYSDSSGIGLHICSKIAEKLGHEINITSLHGTGTQVAITYLTKL